MEFVINYALLMIGITIMAVIYASFSQKKVINKKSNQNFTVQYKDTNKEKISILRIIGTIGAITITILMLSKLVPTNPIIGKWRSETEFPFLGKSIDEIEFTEDYVYTIGMRFKVKYEFDGNKVIIVDEMGIGNVYEIVDKNTLTSNALGFKKVLRRIK